MMSDSVERKGAAALTQRLQELGLSRCRLSKMIGVCSGMVSRWAAGTRIPSLPHAVRLERAIGLPVEVWVE